ncbi:MAG: MMPL family transporter [Undibacterium sp.]|nr:MMPL family transporter [Undibacterium sp.]
MTPDTDILALLPVQERDPILQQSFTHMVDAAQQRLIVLIGAKDWDQAKHAADAYATVLAPHQDLFAITRLTEQTQSDWLAPFEQHRLSLLSARQEKQLQAETPQFWSDTALAKLYSAFSGPKLGSFQDDPFDLFSGWVQERAQETPVRPRDGYLFVADEQQQYVLLAINIVPPAFSLSVQEAILPLLDEAAMQAAQAVESKHSELKILRSGVILHAARAGQQANQEVSTIGLGSLLGIVLLMWASFRSLKPIALILLSITVGFLGALSVCYLLFDRIHLMTLVFGASLIGVAQDYGIYFLCHRAAHDATLNSNALLKKLMPGLLLTLVTTVIGYLGLALTPFPGLRHMAVFSGVGLLFAWLTVICCFPILVSGGSLQQGAWARRYSELLAVWPRIKNSRSSYFVLIGFCIVIGAGFYRLTANDDIRLLQTPPKDLVSEQIQLSRLLDAPTPVQYYLVRGDTAELVLQREEALKQKLDLLVTHKAIGGYQAISNWVPSQKKQSEHRQIITEKLLHEDGPLNLVREKINEDSAWVQATVKHLQQANTPLTLDNFFNAPASQAWRHLWIGQSSDLQHHQFASIVAIKGLQKSGLTRLISTANEVPSVQWVDKIGEISQVLGRYRVTMSWVLCGAYALVFLLMFPRYGRHTWRVLMPTVVASSLTVALLSLTGQPLQLFHVLALMLLLGVGVDYGIFMQELSHQANKKNSEQSTGWLATGLSAISTILSFGLLGLSHTPALQAFGLTMLLGTALVWLITPYFSQETSNAK